MKNVVTIDEIREMELVSSDSFKEYIKLLASDLPSYFKENEGKKQECCPACDSPNYVDQFKKLGFQYRICENCGTLFVSHKPTDEALQDYYSNSQSCRFYYESFISKFEEGRSKKLFLKRCDWILDSVIECDASKNSYLDIRTKYPILFQSIAETNFFKKVSSYRPIFGDLKKAPGSNEVVESLKDIESSSISVISAFEFLDNIFTPDLFIKNIHRILSDKGLFFLTTRCISGFDMQVLWENSNSILPPEHINIFSIEGLIQFFEKNSFEIKELSTPGQLDLDIVANAMKQHPEIQVPKFIEYLIKNREESAYLSFKEFLQKNRLSSHTRIVVQKI